MLIQRSSQRGARTDSFSDLEENLIIKYHTVSINGRVYHCIILWRNGAIYHRLFSLRFCNFAARVATILRTRNNSKNARKRKRERDTKTNEIIINCGCEGTNFDGLPDIFLSVSLRKWIARKNIISLIKKKKRKKKGEKRRGRGGVIRGKFYQGFRFRVNSSSK